MRRSTERNAIFVFHPPQRRSIWRRLLDRLRAEHVPERESLEEIREAFVRYEAGDTWLEELVMEVRHIIWPNKSKCERLRYASEYLSGKDRKLAKAEKTIARLRRRCDELLNPLMTVRHLAVSEVDHEKREITLAPTDAVQFAYETDPVQERVSQKIARLMKTIGKLREEIRSMQQDEMALGALLRRWYTAKFPKREGLTLLELDQIIHLRREPPEDRP